MGFSRQEHWSGLPFPSPGDLPNPGIETWSPGPQANSLPSEPPGKSLLPSSVQLSCSVMSDSLRPHRWQPTRLCRPWDFPGKNTGVDCHFLLQCIKVKSESEVAQSCLTLCDPIDSSPPGSPIPGILQARILEWIAISFSNA